MKTIKVEFYVSTNYHGSEIKEIVEIEVDKTLSGDELEAVIDKHYKEWLFENISSSWHIISSI